MTDGRAWTSLHSYFEYLSTSGTTTTRMDSGAGAGMTEGESQLEGEREVVYEAGVADLDGEEG